LNSKLCANDLFPLLAKKDKIKDLHEVLPWSATEVLDAKFVSADNKNLFDSLPRWGGDEGSRHRLEEFCTVLCENYGGWRWSILSRFWGIFGVLVFGMSVCLSMSVWNGFGIN
jgi:hypothetical protein